MIKHICNTKSSSKVAAVKESESCLTLNKYFRLFLIKVLDMFNSDRILLEFKGSLIIRYVLWSSRTDVQWQTLFTVSLSLSRHLCVYVDAKAVYCTLAEILATNDEFSFCALMVRELNTILFSAAELYEVRMQLQHMEGMVCV